MQWGHSTKTLFKLRRQWKHKAKTSVLATKTVETQGSVLATKAVETQCKDSVSAAKAMQAQGKGSALPAHRGLEAESQRNFNLLAVVVPARH